MDKYFAVYGRYGSTLKTERDSLQKAIEFLAYGNDCGDLFPIGIVSVNGEVYPIDSSVAGIDKKELNKDLIESIKSLGFEVNKIHSPITLEDFSN